MSTPIRSASRGGGLGRDMDADASKEAVKVLEKRSNGPDGARSDVTRYSFSVSQPCRERRQSEMASVLHVTSMPILLRRFQPLGMVAR